MAKTHLEESLKDLQYDNLDSKWHISTIGKFSNKKNLFDYQINAIKNAIMALSVYFADNNSNMDEIQIQKAKQNYHNFCGLESDKFNVYKFVKNGRKLTKNSNFDILEKYYEVKENSERGDFISEIDFFNRMCFWMATASGKTLILIKMIEILNHYMKNGTIPKKDILVLFPNDELETQFKKTINDYNIENDIKINVYSLKEYDKCNQDLLYSITQDINVFSYRTDLLCEKTSQSQLNFDEYQHNGNWYVFLDEAHKGDRNDSSRKNYINIMSRNGFLFNFSATFTDEIDFATTCFNFNLENFIKAGYGKNVYLENESVFTFIKNGDELNTKDKQKEVLKSFIVFTAIKISRGNKLFYHKPLMVTLVNSVKIPDSDCDMFFEEIAKITQKEISNEILENAKQELINEFRQKNEFKFGSEKLNTDILITNIQKITIDTILSEVFNTDSKGKIQITQGEKDKEFVLQLENSNNPFALFRIGDANDYVNEKLKDKYNILNNYEEKRYFDNLNNEYSPINLLIGSRMFYEGWDSNRPNVMNFINLGKGEDGKKFILQSVGRGIRIEPQKNERQRLKANNSEKNDLLETLFIFATKKSVFNNILETMNTQKSNTINLELKENSRKFTLLIPIYKDIKNDNINDTKISLSKNSFYRLEKYLSCFSDEVLFTKFGYSQKTIQNLRNIIKNKTYNENKEKDYFDMDNVIKNICNIFKVNKKDIDGIAELEKDKIIHFKQIQINEEKYQLFKESIDKPFKFTQFTKEQLKDKFKDVETGKISLEEYQNLLNNNNENQEKIDITGVRKTYLAEHYYIPILSTNSQIDYINHIINVESEYNFLNNLNEYVKNTKFDFDWMFSKIDQTIDDKSLAIPYWSEMDNKYNLFFPDFIFWLKKGDKYKIIYVDPKGTEHTSYQNKVDGFEKLFYIDGKNKVFSYQNIKNITVDLVLINETPDIVGEKYRKWWVRSNDFEKWLKIE